MLHEFSCSSEIENECGRWWQQETWDGGGWADNQMPFSQHQKFMQINQSLSLVNQNWGGYIPRYSHSTFVIEEKGQRTPGRTAATWVVKANFAGNLETTQVSVSPWFCVGSRTKTNGFKRRTPGTSSQFPEPLSKAWVSLLGWEGFWHGVLKVLTHTFHVFWRLHWYR